MLKVDHISILFLPTTKQEKQVRNPLPLYRTVLKPQTGICSVYTYFVTAFISKCINDVVPNINFWTFPNKKPWVNGGVCAKLKARSSAYSSGDLEAVRWST